MYIPESAIQFAAIIFAIRFIAGEAAFEHASRRGNVLVFRPVLGLRLMFGVGITLVLFLIAKEGISKNELIWKILLLGFAVWWFIAWPGTILVDQNSIRETRWFGLRRVEIPWTDVVFAGGDFENSSTVRSKDDRTIRHTQYHADQAGFIVALKQYYPECTYNRTGPEAKPWVPLGGP